MPPLYLLIFPTSFLLPNRFAHWALYSPKTEGTLVPGYIYSVKKSGISSQQTQTVNEYFDANKYKDVVYIPIPRIYVEGWVLLEACTEVTEGRKFNLLTRNCQDWVEEVIMKLEDDLKIVDRVNISSLVRAYGYKPLKG